MKKITIFVLNFILIVLMCASCILIILSKTILSKNYVMIALQESSFYNELDDSIQNDIDNYLAKAGIPNGALKSLYTMDDLKNSVEATLDSVYYNKPVQPNVYIKNKINSMLNINTASQSIINQIENVYERKVAISPKYIDKLGQKLTNILPIINIGTIIVIISTIVILIIILIILHNIRESLNTIGIAVFTSGILGMILMILVGHKFDNIFLLNDAFSCAIVYIINDIIGIIFFTGIVMTILGLLIIISEAITKKELHKIL